MVTEKKNDILQVVILTLFMVSVFLLILNFWFAGEREERYGRAQKAVEEYDWLKKNLKSDNLREALIVHKRLKQSEGRKDLHAEINSRLRTQLPGVKASPKFRARRDRSGNYLIHSYQLDSGRGRDKVEFTFDRWIRFLAQVEEDRPGIHTEKITLETKEFDVTASGKRNWTCNARLVLWQPVGQAQGATTPAPAAAEEEEEEEE